MSAVFGDRRARGLPGFSKAGAPATRIRQMPRRSQPASARIRLEPDMLYVDEGDVDGGGQCRGKSTFACMSLERITDREAANRVARRLVVPPHRDGGQAQLIQRPVARERDNARLGPMIDWLRARLDQIHSIKHLAEQARISLRTFRTPLRAGHRPAAGRVAYRRANSPGPGTSGAGRGGDAGRYRRQMRLRLGGNHAASLQAPGRHHTRDLSQAIFSRRAPARDIAVVPRDRPEVNATVVHFVVARPASLITLAHFAVSLPMNSRKCSGASPTTVRP